MKFGLTLVACFAVMFEARWMVSDYRLETISAAGYFRSIFA